MDASADVKVEVAMDASADRSAPGISPEVKGQQRHFQLTDQRPVFDIKSAEAEYAAWLNGSRLVTARQSDGRFDMIFPSKQNSIEVRLGLCMQLTSSFRRGRM
jgi:hypothetical protein